MTIGRKPEIAPEEGASVDVEALIGRGGTVPSKQAPKQEPIEADPQEEANLRRLQLRLEPELIAAIDGVRKTRSIKTPRHTWLLEAVHEKLERERECS